jgi:GxxExxY protein
VAAPETELKKQEHKGHKEIERTKELVDIEQLARSAVDAGLTVHRTLGPGLLESAYEHCLAHELRGRGYTVRAQAVLPISYKGLQLDASYRLDLLIEDELIIEVMAIDALTRVHEAQLATYLKLSGRRLGFLMNFNVALFKDGVKRVRL